MNCPAVSFSGITQARWAAICELVKAKTGIVITSNAGDAKSDGYELKWTFTPEANTLVVQCLAAPAPERFFPASINHAISDWVAKTAAA
jgi:hypothetical protein